MTTKTSHSTIATQLGYGATQLPRIHAVFCEKEILEIEYLGLKAELEQQRKPTEKSLKKKKLWSRKRRMLLPRRIDFTRGRSSLP
jgi:hypothetical protein